MLGSALILIPCLAVGQTCQPVTQCQALGTANAYNSADAGQYIAADDFRLAANGAVTSICWYGVPLGGGPDDFTVTYYIDDGGVPGPVSSPVISTLALPPLSTRISTATL